MNIYFNGIKLEVKNLTLLDFLIKYCEGENLNIKILFNSHDIYLNGFSMDICDLDDPILLKEDDKLMIIKKGSIPNVNIFKEVVFSRFKEEEKNKIERGKVLILGLGGLGSNIAIALARVGVKNLYLIDYDRVDLSNINRQNYYLEDIGKYKVDALKNQIKRINPYINVITENMKVTNKNINDILNFASINNYIVCEAFDGANLKEMVFRNTCENFSNLKLVMGNGMAGILSSNLIKTNKFYKNIYICGDGKSDKDDLGGLFSPRVNICAAHMANMVLRLVLGEIEP